MEGDGLAAVDYRAGFLLRLPPLHLLVQSNDLVSCPASF